MLQNKDVQRLMFLKNWLPVYVRVKGEVIKCGTYQEEVNIL